ncbi:MAG: S24/S26 family peptidase [Conexibacter sp.]
MRPSRSPQPRERRRRILRATLSWAFAALGTVCLLLTAAAFAIGARPVVVRTGSMAPELPVGTVALVRPEPATGTSVGDVVAVVRADGRRILHRVWRARLAGDGAMTLVLRGDRNRSADPPVTVSRVERPLLVLPAVGRPLTWLRGPWVQYWLGVATGLLALAWVALRRRRADVP